MVPPLAFGSESSVHMPSVANLVNNSAAIQSSMATNQIIGFLREYRVLECCCCATVFGFQHRDSGALYCIGGCHQTSPPPTTQQTIKLPLSSSGASNMVEVDLRRVNEIKQFETLNSSVSRNNILASPNPLILASVNANVSTPQHVSAPTKALSTTLVNGPSTVDTVDGGARREPTSSMRQEMTPELIKVAPKPIPNLTQQPTVVKEVQKPETTLQEPAAPLWSKCNYSKSLKSGALVRVTYMWSCAKYHIGAEADDDALNALQESLREHAQKCKPLSRRPLSDELVVSKYDDDFYRARVNKVDGDTCEVIFVDFGDKRSCKFSELLPVNPTIVNIPVFGMIVQLDKLSVPAEGFKLNQGLETAIYGNSYILDLCSKDEPVPNGTQSYPARLWDSKRENTLNDLVKAAINASQPKTSPPADSVQCNRPMWTQCVYSPNMKSKERVRVQFVWNATTFQIVTEADDDNLTKFQEILKQYAVTAKPMGQPPVHNEIVVGKYDGEYYRARVNKVEGDSSELIFVDFGDKIVCKTSEILPVDDSIMKHPIFGLTVHLDKLPTDPVGSLPSVVEDQLYNTSFLLDLCIKTSLLPGEVSQYDVRLWDVKMENTVNEMIKVALGAVSCGWTPLTNEEKKELTYLSATSAYFRETKQLVEETMLKESLSRGEAINYYVFKLDNTDFPYMLADLSFTVPSHTNGVIEVEITKFQTLANIIARSCDIVLEKKLKLFSERIGTWVDNKLKTDNNYFDPKFLPCRNQICLVKWPSWEEISYPMEGIRGKNWWNNNAKDLKLDIYEEDYAKYSGKWFRAACKITYFNDDQKKAAGMFDMFLVDIGKTTTIPRANVYRIPHRFMVDHQMALFLSVRLSDITQYSKKVDDKWKFLLLPGIKIKVKVLWMFDEICIVKLINPTENQFDQHFEHPQVQYKISKLQQQQQNDERQRKVKQMTKMKGTHDAVLKIVLAEEAAEEKLRPFKEKYSGIGRVNPERIFELCLPNPVPSQYRIISTDV